MTTHEEQSGIDATTAERLADSDRSFDVTALLVATGNGKSEYSTELTAEKIAPLSGTRSIESGSRAAYQAGLEQGAARYFASPVMESIALELIFLRIALQQETRRANFWHSRFADMVREMRR